MLLTKEDRAAVMAAPPVPHPAARIKMVLAEWECRWVGKVGYERELFNRFHGAKHKDGQLPEKGFSGHIEGAYGEYCVAKHFGWFWNGRLGDYKAGDVRKVEVRTATMDGGRMLTHDRDPDEARFVLVAGLAPFFHICGWLWGWETKRRDIWWDEPQKGRPCYCVPQKFLRPLRRGAAPGEVLWD